MNTRKHEQELPEEVGAGSENHAFVLRYRREPEGSPEAPARIRIDLEYVNENQRWRYSELDPALTRISDIVDSLEPTSSGPKASRH